MNAKILLLPLLLTCFINCNSQVNTSDPQVSKNIIESKKSGFFVAEYGLTYTSDPNIILEQAWMEKTWFNQVHNGKVKHVAKNYCSLYFKLKQTKGLRYRMDKMNDWLMEYPETGYYVGLAYGTYEIGIPDCKVRDSIKINLIAVFPGGKQKEVGYIVFSPRKKHEIK